MPEATDLTTLIETTQKEFEDALKLNNAKSRELERAQAEFQIAASVRASRIDVLKSSRRELLALEGVVSTSERDAALRDVDKELKELEDTAKTASEAHEATARALVDEINKIREKQRDIEGKTDAHRRLRGLLTKKTT